MKIDFSKTNNKLIPAIIQDDETKCVLGLNNNDTSSKFCLSNLTNDISCPYFKSPTLL